MGIQILIVGRDSLCNFASTNQNNLKLCTKLKSLKILISVRFARQLERMAHLSSVPLMFAEHLAMATLVMLFANTSWRMTSQNATPSTLSVASNDLNPVMD